MRLRRPILNNEVSSQIVRICMDAQSLAKHHTGFGFGFKVRIASDRGTRWLPSSFALLGLTQQQITQVQRKALGKADLTHTDTIVHIRPLPSTNEEAQCCYFWHNSTSATTKGKLRWNANPPYSFWLGKVSGNVRLCSGFQKTYR